MSRPFTFLTLLAVCIPVLVFDIASCQDWMNDQDGDQDPFGFLQAAVSAQAEAAQKLIDEKKANEAQPAAEPVKPPVEEKLVTAAPEPPTEAPAPPKTEVLPPVPAETEAPQAKPAEVVSEEPVPPVPDETEAPPAKTVEPVTEEPNQGVTEAPVEPDTETPVPSVPEEPVTDSTSGSGEEDFHPDAPVDMDELIEIAKDDPEALDVLLEQILYGETSASKVLDALEKRKGDINPTTKSKLDTKIRSWASKPEGASSASSGGSAKVDVDAPVNRDELLEIAKGDPVASKVIKEIFGKSKKVSVADLWKLVDNIEGTGGKEAAEQLRKIIKQYVLGHSVELSGSGGGQALKDRWQGSVGGQKGQVKTSTLPAWIKYAESDPGVKKYLDEIRKSGKSITLQDLITALQRSDSSFSKYVFQKLTGAEVKTRTTTNSEDTSLDDWILISEQDPAVKRYLDKIRRSGRKVTRKDLLAALKQSNNPVSKSIYQTLSKSSGSPKVVSTIDLTPWIKLGERDPKVKQYLDKVRKGGREVTFADLLKAFSLSSDPAIKTQYEIFRSGGKSSSGGQSHLDLSYWIGVAEKDPQARRYLSQIRSKGGKISFVEVLEAFSRSTDPRAKSSFQALSSALSIAGRVSVPNVSVRVESRHGKISNPAAPVNVQTLYKIVQNDPVAVEIFNRLRNSGRLTVQSLLDEIEATGAKINPLVRKRLLVVIEIADIDFGAEFDASAEADIGKLLAVAGKNPIALAICNEEIRNGRTTVFELLAALKRNENRLPKPVFEELCATIVRMGRHGKGGLNVKKVGQQAVQSVKKLIKLAVGILIDFLKQLAGFLKTYMPQIADTCVKVLGGLLPSVVDSLNGCTSPILQLIGMLIAECPGAPVVNNSTRNATQEGPARPGGQVPSGRQGHSPFGGSGSSPIISATNPNPEEPILLSTGPDPADPSKDPAAPSPDPDADSTV